jgi:hypothetical protein
MAANPLNTWIGSGVLSFKEEGESTYRDLGFVPRFVTTPVIERKDYWSKRSKIRSRVRTETTQQGLTIAFAMDEVTAENMAMYFMGSSVAGSPYTTVQMLDRTEIKGALRLVGDNAFGESCQVDIPDCSLMPADAIDWLTDDWLGLSMTGEAFRDPTTGSFGEVKVGITEEVA